ncbi:MAG TPA: cytochrome c maturation protein CcmE [Nitrospiria bacterium]
MKTLYIRWGVLVLAAIGIITSGVQYYNRDVRALSLDQFIENHPAGPVRLLGMIEAGSLIKTADSDQAFFSLAGAGRRLPIFYLGSDTDDLRELKTLVVIGRWDEPNQRFAADKIALVPNYGFITAAYLVLVPMALFLFLMERRVVLLYNEIMQSKQYEPEVGEFE